ncbi:hypothetical protein RB213_015357 [Colletotrichum asianum]
MAILWVWRFEFLALLISCAAFAAIAALLGVYNERAQPEFAYNININTLIAILSTVLKATLVFVVAEGHDRSVEVVLDAGLSICTACGAFLSRWYWSLGIAQDFVRGMETVR